MKSSTIITWIFITCFASISLAQMPIVIEAVIPQKGDEQHALYYDIVYQKPVSAQQFGRYIERRNDGRFVLFALLQNVIKYPQTYHQIRYPIIDLLKRTHQRFQTGEIQHRALDLAKKLNKERELSEDVVSDINQFIHTSEVAPYFQTYNVEIAPSLWPVLQQNITPYYFQGVQPVSRITQIYHESPDSYDTRGLYQPRIHFEITTNAQGKKEKQLLGGDEANRVFLGYLVHGIQEGRIPLYDAKDTILFYIPILFDLLGPFLDKPFKDADNEMMWACLQKINCSCSANRDEKLKYWLGQFALLLPKPNIKITRALLESISAYYADKKSKAKIEVTWHMPCYAEGVYETVIDDVMRVYIGDLPDGSPLSLPIPPLLQRRRYQLLIAWYKGLGITIVRDGSRMFVVGDTHKPPQAFNVQPISRPSALRQTIVPQPDACCQKIHQSVVGVEQTPYLVAPICLTQMGGEGLAPCPQENTCRDMACNRLHTCREGSLCEMWKMSPEEAENHMKTYRHPAGTKMHPAVFKKWREAKDPRAQQVFDIEPIVSRKAAAQRQAPAAAQ